MKVFFDIMDEHGVTIENSEVDEMCELADANGECDRTPVFDFARQSNYWKILTKKGVFADKEMLDKLTKTPNQKIGIEKGPPQISKIDDIVKKSNKINSAFEALDMDKDGFVTKADFNRNFVNLTSAQIEACFKRYMCQL